MRGSLILRWALLAASVLAVPAHAIDTPPPGVRESAAGCWDVGRGITLTLVPYGKHSLTASTRFPEEQRFLGTPAVISKLSAWDQKRGAFDVQCRPRSRHGSFCLVTPNAGGLQVRVYAVRYGQPGVGHLIEELLATRCKTP